MNRAAGFTLIEILVALVVFGFLIVALHQGTRTAFALWDMEARLAGQTEELDATQRTLRTLLTGIPILPITATSTSPAAMALKGEADRVVFVGDLPTGFGSTRLADIAIERRGADLVLVWAPHRHEKTPTPIATAQTELIRGIAGLEFSYFGIEPPAPAPRWQSRWDGPSLPLLIRVSVRFAAGDLRRWPDLVAAPQLAAR